MKGYLVSVDIDRALDCFEMRQAVCNERGEEAGALAMTAVIDVLKWVRGDDGTAAGRLIDATFQ